MKIEGVEGRVGLSALGCGCGGEWGWLGGGMSRCLDGQV